MLSDVDEVTLDVLLFLIYTLSQQTLESSALDLDQTGGLRGLDLLTDELLPVVELLKLVLDGYKSNIFLLPLFEVELSVELIDLSTFLVGLNILGQLFEVIIDVLLDPLLGLLILFRMLNDGSISWTRFVDQTVDELMEVSVTNNSLLIFGNSLHVLQDLLEVSDEVSVSRVEDHAIIITGKGDLSLDLILSGAIILVHLSDDGVSGVLVDGDLSLNYHVVYQPNEGSKRGIVLLGQSHDLLLELLFLLHDVH